MLQPLTLPDESRMRNQLEDACREAFQKWAFLNRLSPTASLVKLIEFLPATERHALTELQQTEMYHRFLITPEHRSNRTLDRTTVALEDAGIEVTDGSDIHF